MFKKYCHYFLFYYLCSNEGIQVIPGHKKSEGGGRNHWSIATKILMNGSLFLLFVAQRTCCSMWRRWFAWRWTAGRWSASSTSRSKAKRTGAGSATAYRKNWKPSTMRYQPSCRFYRVWPSLTGASLVLRSDEISWFFFLDSAQNFIAFLLSFPGTSIGYTFNRWFMKFSSGFAYFFPSLV